ncbi:hypothetical protein OsI_33057 [Oryza sativa Indica Group]|uniref:Uncharacterized protein n=1 Tax=Oryza sativa subsp. indica TaxID=39946 RepID=B8BG69_ORYSI|nr:hypothetical protein OsI_33057 [Oryza sativa Indica Group]
MQARRLHALLRATGRRIGVAVSTCVSKVGRGDGEPGSPSAVAVSMRISNPSAPLHTQPVAALNYVRRHRPSNRTPNRCQTPALNSTCNRCHRRSTSLNRGHRTAPLFKLKQNLRDRVLQVVNKRLRYLLNETLITAAAALDPRVLYTSNMGRQRNSRFAVTLALKKIARSSLEASNAIEQFNFIAKRGLFGGDEARRDANKKGKARLEDVEEDSAEDYVSDSPRGSPTYAESGDSSSSDGEANDDVDAVVDVGSEEDHGEPTARGAPVGEQPAPLHPKSTRKRKVSVKKLVIFGTIDSFECYVRMGQFRDVMGYVTLSWHI